MKRVIHWFRRDLRVSDNAALSAAAQRAEDVVPVFVWDEAAFRSAGFGEAQLAFMTSAIMALCDSLRALGYELIIRYGRPEVELPRLCKELRAEAVFCNKGYEPDEKRTEERVFCALNAGGFGFELFKDRVVWEEQEILTQSGRPFTVFTPYAKAWKTRPIPAPKPTLKRRHPEVRQPKIKSLGLPVVRQVGGKSQTTASQDANEKAALALLEKFMSGPVYEYAATRDYPAIDGTSRLSPHLRWGTIGVRTVLAALQKARARARSASDKKSCDVFLTELIWREFYNQILANFPHVAVGSFRLGYDRLEWSENREHFQAWCNGVTGYPIVDAAMRCLNTTGWLHNRLRMIVAMFLTKDLMINWQWGERYFMSKLVDADLAANNGGWQWSAGTGTDAAPYFRIFNPVAQGQKFDPQGDFVRRWVPELGWLKGVLIHRPWMQPELFSQTQYPHRIVLHEQQRLKALALYRAVRRHRTFQ